MKRLGIGLVGSGFMGRSHAHAFRAAPGVFDLPLAMPRLRPPYPAERGFRGRPTVINNVEPLACVPWILRHGPEAFAALGTEASKGTKVFALAGKIRHGGLICGPSAASLLGPTPNDWPPASLARTRPGVFR